MDNDTMVAVTLKPCPNPWCESHKYGQEGAPTREDIMWLSGTESRLVGCAYCNLQGPIGKGEDEAIALWNDRGPDPDRAWFVVLVDGDDETAIDEVFSSEKLAQAAADRLNG